MLCNERSPIKLTEANLDTDGFMKYSCYDDVEELLDNCGADIFETLFEIYRYRLMSEETKPRGYARLYLRPDPYSAQENG